MVFGADFISYARNPTYVSTWEGCPNTSTAFCYETQHISFFKYAYATKVNI